MLELNAPISIVWEITNNCNYRCPHCRAYQQHTEEDQEIEKKIIDEMIESNVFVVNISGGEPLLNPRVFEIAKKLTENNIYVIISTNGYFYEKYRKQIVDSGIKLVQVSVDGPKELHEKFRGIDGSFDRAINALKMAKEDGLRTQMNVTITAENLDTLEWNFEKAKELGVSKVFYRRVVPYGKAKLNQYVLPEKEKYYAKLKKLASLNSKELQVLIDDPVLSVLLERDNDSYLACSAGINNLGISSNGDVFPCIFLREKLGNLNEEKLSEIWQKSKILKKLRERKIKVCGTCKYNYACGGCRAFSGIFEKDSFCPLDRR